MMALEIIKLTSSSKAVALENRFDMTPAVLVYVICFLSFLLEIVMHCDHKIRARRSRFGQVLWGNMQLLRGVEFHICLYIGFVLCAFSFPVFLCECKGENIAAVHPNKYHH